MQNMLKTSMALQPRVLFNHHPMRAFSFNRLTLHYVKYIIVNALFK